MKVILPFSCMVMAQPLHVKPSNTGIMVAVFICNVATHKNTCKYKNRFLVAAASLQLDKQAIKKPWSYTYHMPKYALTKTPNLADLLRNCSVNPLKKKGPTFQ